MANPYLATSMLPGARELALSDLRFVQPGDSEQTIDHLSNWLPWEQLGLAGPQDGYRYYVSPQGQQSPDGTRDGGRFRYATDAQGNVLGQYYEKPESALSKLAPLIVGAAMTGGAALSGAGLGGTAGGSSAAGGSGAAGGIGGGLGAAELGIGADFGMLSGLGAESAATSLTGGALGGFGGTGLGGFTGAGLGSASALPTWLTKAGESAGGLLKGDAVKGVLTAAGALAGAKGSGGETLTSGSKIDERLDPYIFGGLLPAASDWFSANKTGVNPAMQQGWDMQMGLLQNPALMQELASMRSGALARSQAPVARNPFGGR